MIAAASWLWWQARGHDSYVSNYRVAAAEVRNINRLAEDWQAATVRVWANAAADTAQLATLGQRISQYEESLARAVVGLPHLPPRLANDLSAYSNAIEARTERVERFKSSLDAIRDSVRRLPARVADVVDAVDRTGEPTDIADHIASLAARIPNYVANPDELANASLTLALESLADGARQYAPALGGAVTAFVDEAHVLLARLGPTNALFQAATAADIDVFADDLASTLDDALADVARRGTRDQVLAMALAGTTPLLWLTGAMKRSARRVEKRDASAATNGEAVDDAADADGSPPVEFAGADTLQPLASDVRIEHSLLRTRLLVDLIADELAGIAEEADDGGESTKAQRRTTREQLAGLANGLADRRWDQNTRYATVDVNQCVKGAVAAGTRCGFVTVATRFAELPAAFAAEAELEVMFANLVENAVQAARRDHGDEGRITVATSVEDGKAVVTIADNGPGVASQSQGDLFQPFRRMRHDHLGIGLASAAKLADRNGATISLHSTEEGTAARIVLPGHA